MKTPLLIIASIVIAVSQTTFADNAQANNNKSSKKKADSIESLLAEKNLIQGKIAKRIRTYNIDTWRRLDNYHLLIEGKGRNNDYLIKFRNKCYNTRNGSTLIYKTNNNELTKFDSIGVLDSFIHSQDALRPTRSCTIEDIYYLDKLTADDLSAKKVDKKTTEKLQKKE